MGRISKVVIAALMLICLFLFSSSLTSEAKSYKYKQRNIRVRTSFKPSRSMYVLQPAIKSPFKSYKVIIIADKLNIRLTPSSNGKIVGSYIAGNVVDILGKTSNYVKTDDGYIAEAYTKKIAGMFAEVSGVTQVINVSGKIDDRVAIPGKEYKIIDSKNNNILVKIGRINGYINQDALSSINDSTSYRVTLGWEYLNKAASNAGFYNDPSSYVNTRADVLGLDALSPTWFSIIGNANVPSSITINDIGDKKYVTTAHKNGYEVWARFSETDKTRASVEFNNPMVRSNLINQISNLALSYDLDGINVDFEALGSVNKDGFTNFMKELYNKLKSLNLNVSVDITKISKVSDLYSLCYDRSTLANYCDYLMLMGYDEHYSTSTEPGSVGSYNFVDTAISDIIDQGVPGNKLILAVPLYLRDFAVIPYDAVMYNQKGKVYNIPVAVDNNLLLNGKKGNLFKCLGSDGNWYVVDYNGIKGYVAKNIALFLPSNQLPGTTDSSINITTGGGINTLTGGAITVAFPYDVIVINQDGKIYRSENQIENNKIADTSVKDYFKYIGTQGSWYIIDYKGKQGYVQKSQADYYKADTRAINSSAVSITTAEDRLSQYNGTIYEDDISRQNVESYIKDGIKHLIWLENGDSMSWRMDLVNEYDLAGAAAWSLYWKPTQDIWDTIKSKMKN